MHRLPENLPKHHVLYYKSNIEYKAITDHLFSCQFSSYESSGKEYAITNKVDTSK